MKINGKLLTSVALGLFQIAVFILSEKDLENNVKEAVDERVKELENKSEGLD